MSIYKVPKGVFHDMESIRSKFFNGADLSEKKITWVAWDRVLASKKNGGLGVSSFHALNRALLLKWVWRFISQDGSIWSRVIRAIYGTSIDLHSTKYTSNWCSILREVQVLSSKGFDFVSRCKKRVGNGCNTRFWLDIWVLDCPLSIRFPRDRQRSLDKEVSVSVKMGANSIVDSFRRPIRDGVERQQWGDLSSILDTISLSSANDRWSCDVNGDDMFRVKDIRSSLDDIFLPSSALATRWVKYIPIKINIFIWRARLDRLPTRSNLANRGVVLDSLLCPICGSVPEDASHFLFQCGLSKLVFRKICRWWDLVPNDMSSFFDWDVWFSGIRLPCKLKLILEGVFYVAWWHILRFRNQSIFAETPPRRSVLFDDIVSRAFDCILLVPPLGSIDAAIPDVAMASTIWPSNLVLAKKARPMHFAVWLKYNLEMCMRKAPFLKFYDIRISIMESFVPFEGCFSMSSIRLQTYQLCSYATMDVAQ
ncbi:RNA-directed DNA polymerase, eukaryota, partial [Tanacetum coccineum]